ncbi:nidogen-like domain-containing protein [Ditylenchus destructor]|nr:nidogen-like domain-containing protein [Ditylenchus destructor]
MLHLNIFICFGVLLPWTTAVVPLDKFFGYGPENGDEERRDHLISSGHIELDPPFSMFALPSNEISIYEVSEISIYNWRESAEVDLARDKSGIVYWRKSISATDVKKAREEIGSAFPAYEALDLKWVVIATWYQVSPYRNYQGSTSTNTFQAILTTDGNQSFAIFNYNEIGWSMANGRHADVGFGMDYGHRLTLHYDYKVSGSGHPDISTIGNRSNTASNTTGKWIFRIDQTTILEPSSVCATPPQPENGFCTAEGFTSESLAQCTCKDGYMPDRVDSQLKCSKDAESNNANWTGNVPVCRSLIQTTAQSPQLPANPSDCAVKLCPLPPIPQYGKCENMDYHPGSSAICKCHENYRNTNPHSKLYCVFSEDGDLVWTGGMPMCVNSST